jgi:hypothetical protein
MTTKIATRSPRYVQTSQRAKAVSNSNTATGLVRAAHKRHRSRRVGTASSQPFKPIR